MNWSAFFGVFVVMFFAFSGVVLMCALGDWIEKRLGLGWSLVIVTGVFVTVMATFAGLAA